MKFVSKCLKDMKQYKSIDLFKFFCAFLIIVLHTSPFSSYSNILTFGIRNIITIIAVPFFFISSGFMVFKKLETFEIQNEKNAYMKKHIKRIIIMYLFWSAVYFVFILLDWIFNGFSIYALLEYIKDFVFEGSLATIWFLPALIVATLIVFFLRQKYSYKTIFLVSLPFYVFALLGSSYYGITEKLPILSNVFTLYYSFFDTIKNGLCFGFIYVSLGALIAYYENRICISKSKTLILIFIFFVLVAIEQIGLRCLNLSIKGIDTIIMLVPLSFLIFIFILKMNCKGDDKIYLLFRKYSMLMFLTQRIPLTIVSMFLNNTIIATNSIIYFFVILLTTFIISTIILKITNKIKFLKYAY